MVFENGGGQREIKDAERQKTKHDKQMDTITKQPNTNISYSKLERDEFAQMLSHLQIRTRRNKSYIFKEALRHYYSRHFPNKEMILGIWKTHRDPNLQRT